MPITLITGPANAGKAELVMGAVRRHCAHGAEPLLVLPTRVDADHYLRELAAAGVALGIRVERFDGLLSTCVQRAEVGGQVLDGAGREQLAAAVLARQGGGPPGAGVVRALGEAIAELRRRRVAPERLSAALEGGRAGGAVLGRLARLYAAYARELERIGRVDRDERAAAALDELRRRPAAWGGVPVLVYGFDDLEPLQLDAIETLGRVVDAEVTVALAYEPGRVAFAGRAAAFHALAPIAAEHVELDARAEHYAPASRAALSHLERSLFEAEPERVDPGEAVRLLEGGGERAELELVADEARRLIDGGLAPEEIAIVLRAGPARAALVEEVLGAAGVPYALQRRVPFGHTALGRSLLGMLRCVPDDLGGSAGDLGGSAGDLLAWLRAPGLLEHAELADRLELGLRRAGIVAAGPAREQWEQVNWPLDALDRIAQSASRSPAALAERAGTELQRLFAAPHRRRADVLDADEHDQARALADGSRALRQLRELARADRAIAPSSAAQLADVLERVEVVCGQAPGPGLVAVLDPLELRARRVRALFVCCMQEGTFPAPARPRPFLGDDERRMLAERGLLLGEAQDALAADRYLLYAAVSRPQEHLYLSWHLTGDDGEPKSRSLFVDDICDLFDESLVEQRLRRPLGALASGAGVAGAAAGAVGAVAPSVRIEPISDELLLRELGERPWSASSLERWIACPARWFVERLLAPREFDPDPEQLARGGLAHEVLRDVFEGVRAATGSARLDPSRLDLARRLLDEALAEHEAGRPLSASPERALAARRRLHSDLARYLAYAGAQASPLEPTELELGFGFEGEAELPAFDLGEGLRLRGRIDRVDRTADGEALVYDYKYKDVPIPARWVSTGSVQMAVYMRVVEQLLGVRVAGGLYQSLSGEKLAARGVVDNSSEACAEATVRGDARDRSEVDEIVAEAIALAREAAVQAARGEIESRPRTCGFRNSGCQFPSICRCQP